MKFPNIDQKQARRQLELLGYKWNDNVFLRFFYPTDDPRKNTDKGRKADRLNWQQIEAYQKQGRGVYFVINGGGHKNADVTEGRAFFIEHDHLPKEEQRELWKKLGLPKPSLQVDTGNKSVHSFWLPDKPVPIPQWCELQKDLLEYTDGDRSIKNPARVMRLAGAWHIKIDEEGNPVYNQSKIISDSGQKYSYEELRAKVPYGITNYELRMTNGVIPNSEFRSRSEAESKSEANFPNSYDQIKIPVPQPIPLLECCRKEVREWVKTGVPQGQGRNDTAINVGLELIAVERYLQQISQPFTDSARQLFTEYCQKSGMTAQENEERFMWCLDKNPNPSCGEEGIAACIRGWYWKNAELGDNNSKGKGQNSAPKNNRKSPIPNSEFRTPNSNVTGDTRGRGDS